MTSAPGDASRKFWEGFWRFVGVLIVLAAGAWAWKHAIETARTGRFEFRHFWRDPIDFAGNPDRKTHAFDGVEARRVSAGLYGVGILCAVWSLRIVAPGAWFTGRLRKIYARLSLASLAACVVILFPPWRILSSWPVLTLYFLPAATMIVVAATHRVAESRRKDLRGKIWAFCFMIAFVLCAIGEGDAFATAGLGAVSSFVVLSHVETLTARPGDPSTTP